MPLRAAPAPFTARSSSASRRVVLARSHKVEIEHEGKTYTLDVPDGSTILEVALDKGLDLPHDCKLGVCMTCPAKLVSLLRGSGVSWAGVQEPSATTTGGCGMVVDSLLQLYRQLQPIGTERPRNCTRL